MDRTSTRSITESDLECMLLDKDAEPRALPFSLLEKITNGFSYKREIGRGGFAVVYMGILENGVVAVKRLSNTYMFEKEFLREVECLMKVKHKNIVRFLGYCCDTQGNMERYNGKHVMAEIQERLLCFEYVPKGSLDGYIKGASHGLEWSKRYEIIKGICDGLYYLHHLNILHLDIKPLNVLMDDNFIPKITDFGLSRSFEELQSRVVATKMFGTMGYLAPEFSSHVITHKFDLYSLGVIIMEMLTGQKECQAIEIILESWDKRLKLSQGNAHWEQIRVCAKIAIECTNIDPAKRPDSMKHVIDRLAETESIEENDVAKLLSDEKELSIEGCNGALAVYNMRERGHKKICDATHISLSDLQKLTRLRSIHFKRCDDIFSAEMCHSVVLHSVVNLHIEELQITGELFSKVLRCFPALSQLTITKCKNLELLYVEGGGLSDLKLLQSFTGYNCWKLFSGWPTGEVHGRAQAIKPFPTSLRELNIFLESSMQSMGLLSNLTSLTSLSLEFCEELTMHGFNPHIIVNLKKLVVDTRFRNQEGISIAGDLLSEIARSRLLHAGSFQLEELWVDNISAVLTAPLCSHLAATLNILQFNCDPRMTTFTAEQEKALRLLTSLQILEFRDCPNLQSVPQGLDGLCSLKRLVICLCEKILSLPPKVGLPTSLEEVEVNFCSPELTEQAEKLKGADPWFLVEVRV